MGIYLFFLQKAHCTATLFLTLGFLITQLMKYALHNAHCTMHKPAQHDLNKVGRSRAGIDSILQRLERMVRHPRLMVLVLNIDYHSLQDVARPMIGSAKKLKLSYRFASCREKIIFDNDCHQSYKLIL